MKKRRIADRRKTTFLPDTAASAPAHKRRPKNRPWTIIISWHLFSRGNSYTKRYATEKSRDEALRLMQTKDSQYFIAKKGPDLI